MSIQAVGTDRNIAQSILEHRAELLSSLLKLFHRDIQTIHDQFSATGQYKNLSEKLYHIFETYLPILQYNGNIFQNMPISKLPKVCITITCDEMQFKTTNCICFLSRLARRALVIYFWRPCILCRVVNVPREFSAAQYYITISEWKRDFVTFKLDKHKQFYFFLYLCFQSNCNAIVFDTGKEFNTNRSISNKIHRRNDSSEFSRTCRMSIDNGIYSVARIQ